MLPTTSRLNTNGSSPPEIVSDEMSDELSDDLEMLLDTIQECQMGQPALLFVAGFRPLAFVVGQGLYALAPVAGAMGWDGCRRWAALLSHRDGPALLEERLYDGIERNHT